MPDSCDQPATAVHVPVIVSARDHDEAVDAPCNGRAHEKVAPADVLDVSAAETAGTSPSVQSDGDAIFNGASVHEDHDTIVIESAPTIPDAVEHAGSTVSPLAEGTANDRMSVSASDAALAELKQDTTADSNDSYAPAAPMRPSKKRGAVYKDRRGARRTPAKPLDPAVERPTLKGMRKAELRLRLMIDPIPRSITLSAVLVREDGFPDRLLAGFTGEEELLALDGRYDDLPIIWTSELLQDELRLADSEKKFEWVRAARDMHIFAEQSGESDLVSVPAATTGARHAIICRTADVPGVLAIATSARSAPLQELSSWQGVPHGWSILDGYAPQQAADPTPEGRLRTLDPGTAVDILFEDGLPIRSRVWAVGSPPTIRVSSLPANGAVLIDGRSASVSSSGVCTAEGWDQPGTHLVDVIPGGSCTYQIAPDPAVQMEWEDTVGMTVGIGAVCGPRIISGKGKWVIARHGSGQVVVLGQGRHAKALATREGLPAAIGAVSFKAEFLIVSWGLRRSQGEIIWLDAGPHAVARGAPDAAWISAVRSAAARQLPIRPSSEEARLAWNRAVALARTYRKGRA